MSEGRASIRLKGRQVKENETISSKESEPNVICYNCTAKHNISEVAISEEEYNFMKENYIPGYVWVCKTCLEAPKPYAAFEDKINKKLDQIQKQIETNDTKKKVDGLEKYIDLKPLLR